MPLLRVQTLATTYALTVQVKDSGKPSLTASATITVNVQPQATTLAVVSLARSVSTPIQDFTTDYLLTFNKPVTGVDASNFTVVLTGGVSANPTVDVTKISDTQYKITINVIERFGDGGTLGLNLVDSDGNIKDLQNNTLGPNFTFLGQVYAALP